MIVSASRRTDLPAFYSEWLLRRFREGFALVRSPFDAGRLYRVPLTLDAVDGAVFWTKNPRPMMESGALDEIEALGFPFYFQFTLTPYGADLERALPPKTQLERTFLALCGRLGPQRVVWRYDPVILGGERTVSYHLKAFSRLCRLFSGRVHRCVISFVDLYRKIPAAVRETLAAPSGEEMRLLARGFADAARAEGIEVSACCEKIDLSECGVGRSCCIDARLLGRIAGVTLRARPDRNQRPGCGCCESADIGDYDTCLHGCVYCYATSGEKRALERRARHDPASPLLVGAPRGGERITVRKNRTLRDGQLSLL